MNRHGSARSIEIIAGTPPGGGQDRAARALAGILDSGVTVTNSPGRGGGNGWDRLATLHGAAEVLAVSSPTLITNTLLGDSDLDYRLLTPIALLYTEYSVLVVTPSSGYDDPMGYLDGLAAGAVTTSFATARGNINHLALAMLARHARVDVAALQLRVFESARHALADLLADNADAAMVSAVSAQPELDDGSLLALAVTSPRRLAGRFARVPSWAELSVDCHLGTWRGLVAPPGINDQAVAEHDDLVSSALADPRWGTLLEKNLWVDTRLGPDDTRRFLDDQRELLGSLLVETGLVLGADGG